jgi:hypothetical protein
MKLLRHRIFGKFTFVRWWNHEETCYALGREYSRTLVVRTLCAMAFIALLAAGSQPLAAQSTNVLGSHVQSNIGGTLLAKGKVCFFPTDQNDQLVTVNGLGGIISASNPACGAIASGVVDAGFVVADSALTNPAGIYYRIEITDLCATCRTHDQVITRLSKVANVKGATWSLDAYVPSGVILPPSSLYFDMTETVAPGNPNSGIERWFANSSTHLLACLTSAGANCNPAAGGGSGTVTSVGLVLPSIFNVTVSPITTNGSLTATLANENANTIFAGPSSGAAAAPTFRVLVAADIPSNAANTTGNASTATALAANGSNCGANQYAQGVDAGGNAEGCSQPAASTLSNGVTGSGLVVLQTSPTVKDLTTGQTVNGDDSLFGLRATDSSPTGNFIHFANAANNADLWRIDITGTLQAGTVPGARVSGAISGNAGTATALAANGSNCSSGNYPLGVDAGGNAESCTAIPVTSVFGRSGAVVANSGDYSASQVTNAEDKTVANTLTNVAAPATPSAGFDAVYADSTDKRFHDKNDAGTIGTTVVADTGASNNFLTAISAAGAISKAQPGFSNLSGSAACGQLPALTGDVTTSAGFCATALGNIPDLATQAASILATAIAAPSTPAAGKAKVYVNSTSKKLCSKDDAGVESCVGAGAGSGTTLQVGGASVNSAANLSNSTPAAAANTVNASFQKDASATTNISANVPVGAFDPISWVMYYDEFLGNDASKSGGVVKVTSGSLSFTDDPNGSVTFTTGSTSGNNAYWYASGDGGFRYFHLGQKTFDLKFRLKLSSTTTTSAWCGMEGGGSLYPDSNNVAFRYDTNASDATWKALTDSTVTDLAVTPDTSFHTFRIRSTTAGTVLFSIDSGSETSIAYSATNGLGPSCEVITRTAATRAFTIDYYWFVVQR